MEFSSNMYIKEEIQDKPHDISAVTENNSIRTKIVSTSTYICSIILKTLCTYTLTLGIFISKNFNILKTLYF